MTTSPAIDALQLRGALGSFATGVTIVTTRQQDGHDIGLTANSFNSVSLDPPLVLWSLARSSLSLKAFTEAEYFAVHILAADQEPLSNRFAKRGLDKFAGLSLERGHGGIPLLDGCAARFECRTAFRYDGGDHEIFVGQIVQLVNFARPPLVFHGGRYAISVQKPQHASELPMLADSSFERTSLQYLLARAHYQLDLKMGPVRESHQLSESEHTVLSLLGAEDDRSLSDLQALVAWTGRPITLSSAESLQRRGLIQLNGIAEALRAQLTPAGRAMAIELTAAAKAHEEDAIDTLDFAEAQMLKHLLKRVVRRTDPGVPAIWRRHDKA